MSFNNFLGEREALTYGSEMYKSTVIRYFQLEDYSVKTSSSQEGHLPDLIMIKEGEPDLWIEVKRTKVSIFEKKFKKEILDYFCYLLRRKSRHRVKFVIFTEGITRHNDTKDILTSEANLDKIKEWISDNENLNLSEDNVKLLSHCSDDEISIFFLNTDVNVCAGYDLELIVQDRRREAQWSPNYKSKKLLDETIRRRSPTKSQSEIITNFMKLNYPKYFFEIDSKYKLKKTIFEKLDTDERLPEFAIPRFEDEQAVIRSFESDLSVLSDFTLGSTWKRETNLLEHRRKIELLQVSLNRWLWCKGFRRLKNEYYIPYENLNRELLESENPPITIKGKEKEKQVVKVMYKDGTFNFVQHHGLRIRIEKMGDQLGLLIWPIFFFTSNGINQVDRDWNSRLHRRYRTSVYNYNPNKRSEIKFWEDFLQYGDFVREEDSWFAEIKLHPLKIFKVNWIPETIEKDQTTLEEWF